LLWFQAAGVNSSKSSAPQADCLATDCGASSSEKVFAIPVAQIEAVVQPDCIRNKIRREMVTLVVIHHSIISIAGVNLSLPILRSRPPKRVTIESIYYA